MAKNFARSRNLVKGPMFQARCKTCLTIVAEAVKVELTDTPFHDLRVQWAKGFLTREVDQDYAPLMWWVSTHPEIDEDCSPKRLCEIIHTYVNIFAAVPHQWGPVPHKRTILDRILFRNKEKV